MTASTAASTDASRRAWEVLQIPNGEHAFVHATGDEFESTDPATLDPVALLRSSTPADLDAAVGHAREALLARTWSADGVLRARVLHGFADALLQERHRLGELLTREQGQTLAEAVNEVERAAGMVDFYAGLARAVYGRSAVLGPSSNGVLLHEPMGVVGVITPWNMPITLLARSIAPALAAGNSCVVKPASWTAAITVEVLSLLARQVGLPPGVMSCVLGSGAVVGDALVVHEGIDMIAFTGETSTGAEIMKRASGGLKKVALELGGKSPNLVFADAELPSALALATKAAFKNAGQICTAPSRLLVQQSAFDEAVDRVAPIVRGFSVRDGLDPASTLGPVASAVQRDSVNEYRAIGLEQGELVAEADAPEESGCFVRPSVFTGLPPESRLLHEEIFGPVMTLQSFSDEDEAVALANNSEYGLAAGLWTSNLDRAWRVGGKLQAGTVWINTYHRFYPEMEVGGYKHSGIGRQLGMEGLYEFTQTKHLNFQGA